MPEEPKTSTARAELDSIRGAIRSVETTLHHHTLLVADGWPVELSIAGRKVIKGCHGILVDQLELLEDLIGRIPGAEVEWSEAAHVRRYARLAALALFSTVQEADSGVDVPETLALAVETLDDARDRPWVRTSSAVPANA